MVIKYIQGTIVPTLILSINKSGNIKWYVDVAFAVHKNIRGHTGGFITMAKIGAYVQSIKYNMNTKITNEADLVVLDDIQNQIICTRYFLKD